MSKQDVDKIKKLVNILDDMVEIGEVVFEDGKISLTDITEIPKLGNVINDLVQLWGAKDEMAAELKDLDVQELKELLDAAFDG